MDIEQCVLMYTENRGGDLSKDSEIVVKRLEGSDRDLSGDLAIHIPRKDFGNFIKSLLGHPYEISREVFGQFDLDQQAINQLIHVVNQRICQQHDAVLAEFTGTIRYSGGVQKKISDMDAFIAFVETVNRKSVGVSLKVTYLIKFPGKEVPEKQQISFIANGYDKEVSNNRDDFPFVIVDSRRVRLNSSMLYRIESTERTWAEDIESLIKSQFALCFVEDTWSSRLFGWMRTSTVTVIAISSIAVPVVVEYLRVSDASSSIEMPNISPSTNPNEAISMIAKMFHDYILIGVNFIHILYYMIFVIACIIFCIYLSSRGDTQRSFVIYTDSTRSMAKEFRDRQKRHPISFVRDVIASIIIGGLLNYVFLKYSHLFT